MRLIIDLPSYVARSSDDLMQSCANFRCQEWIEANRSLHHSNPSRILNRKGGAQQQGWDYYLYCYAMHGNLGSWQSVAQDRSRWQALANGFVEFVLNIFQIHSP
mmetsp:Transcript_18755/g.34956  ORF Transcript_18755/g.34956 Transcript_18755/m.34956 type:complete len:104 (+) Transcript_18755:78-389(+)